MQQVQCPNCGSNATPIHKVIWSKTDKIISVALCVLFFPAGIIFILIKLSSGKKPVCPVCKMQYKSTEKTNENIDFDKVKTVAKAIARDPEIRQSTKELAKSLKSGAKGIRDTMYIN